MEPKTLDIHTVAKLLGPLEPVVQLVPLKELKRAEDSLKWGVLFLIIASVIVGALMALYASSYSNGPVLFVLILFALVFLGLTFFFLREGIQQRTITFHQAITTRGRAYIKTMSQQDYGLIGLQYKILLYLKDAVFQKSDTLSKERLISSINDITSTDLPDEILNSIADSLINADIVQRIDPTNPDSNLRLNPSWDPEKKIEIALEE